VIDSTVVGPCRLADSPRTLAGLERARARIAPLLLSVPSSAQHRIHEAHHYAFEVWTDSTSGHSVVVERGRPDGYGTGYAIDTYYSTVALTQGGDTLLSWCDHCRRYIARCHALVAGRPAIIARTRQPLTPDLVDFDIGATWRLSPQDWLFVSVYSRSAADSSWALAALRSVQFKR
jgi:hypothetical protein